MSTYALARQWRPRSFRELLGQPSLTTALTHSLDSKRLHHAYLFTGTRGIGKTTVARLLAKALNCETGISPEPCLVCDACKAIEQGQFPDLIEVDGASRTRVEDTREILENVVYAPTVGRFRIYLIDEVHMLSQHSFNALLKTLEEPPEHVKFFLATTELRKIPQTVLSRCLQFTLRPLDSACIAQHMRHILEHEHLPFEDAAITLLSRAASGSMRDGLSLLDQAIASGAGNIREEQVRDMLGYTREDHAIAILEALSRKDAHGLLAKSHAIAASGGHFVHALQEVLSRLHDIACQQALGDSGEHETSHAGIRDLATQFTPEDTQLCYQIALRGMEDIHLAPTLLAGFDMILLRMLLFRPARTVTMPAQSSEALPAENSAAEPERISEHPGTIPASLPTGNAPPEHETGGYLQTCPGHGQTAASLQNSVGSVDWNHLLPALNLTGLALSAAENAAFGGKHGNTVTLRVHTGHQSLFTKTVIARIAKALSDHFRETVHLELESSTVQVPSRARHVEAQRVRQQDAAAVVLETDPVFRQICEEFSAQVVKNSVTCHDEPL